jgi:hypothetical protein
MTELVETASDNVATFFGVDKQNDRRIDAFQQTQHDILLLAFGIAEAQLNKKKTRLVS